MEQSTANRCPVHEHAAAWPAEEITDCPFGLYAQLREEAPIYKRPDRDEFYVTRFEDLVFIARRPDIFSNDLFGSGDASVKKILWRGDEHGSDSADPAMERRTTPFPSASSDPPEHRGKRLLALDMVSSQRMRDYEPMIRAHCDELIDGWIGRGECSFRSEFSDLLPVRVIADILGLPSEDWPLFLEWGDIEAGGAARYASEERLAADHQMTLAAASYMREALLDRHANPRDDFLTHMIQAQIAADGAFDLDYLTGESSLLLFAGNVTTAHMIATMMTAAAADPELFARLSAERSLLEGLVEEALRLEAPVQWTQRRTKVDTEVNGVQMPAGSWVLLFWGSGNRDGERFDAPDQLQLQRPSVVKHQLAFGHGIHRCAGAPLARLEGRIAFDVLLDRLASVHIDQDASDLRNLASVRFRAPRKLQLEFAARA